MTNPENTPRRIITIMAYQHRADLTAREGFGVDSTPSLDRLRVARGGCGLYNVDAA